MPALEWGRRPLGNIDSAIAQLSSFMVISLPQAVDAFFNDYKQKAKTPQLVGIKIAVLGKKQQKVCDDSLQPDFFPNLSPIPSRELRQLAKLQIYSEVRKNGGREF